MAVHLCDAVTYIVRDSPIPPAPETHTIFDPLQWATLLAIADTIIPSIRRQKSAIRACHQAVADSSYNAAIAQLVGDTRNPDRIALAEQYLDEHAIAVPGFKDALCRTLGLYVPLEARRDLLRLLSILNYRTVSLALTGSTTPFRLQPVSVRESILQSWETSYFPALRRAYRSLVALSLKAWTTASPTLPKILGLPRIPVHGRTGQDYPYSFLQFPPGDHPEVIEADVVIVGSGCGAGVAAKNLAEAGYSVIVVEKSYHYSVNHYPMTPAEGTVHLFANGGVELSDDGSTSVISGSTWGGGGTVNWSASLQTQSFVREEWANSGLDFFTSLAFQDSLDRICDYMGVSTDHIEHNFANNMIIEGARKLGYTAKAVPQNTGHQEHYCGYCTFGCAAAIKQGPAVSFLADAARAGALFVEGYEVDKVLFDRATPKSTKVASGVQGIWKSRDANGMTSGEPVVTRKLIVKAKKVIVSCGSLQSPLLLLRSGLNNAQIGRNLHLHPVSVVSAIYDEETRPWEGGILTAVVTDFENVDGIGHGTKIEALTMLPSMVLPVFSSKGGLDFKLFAASLRNMSGMISLTRDRDSGTVYPDPVDGRCRIRYTPSAYDRSHMLEGVIASAKIAYVSGAKEIRTTCHNIPPFIRPTDSAGSDEEGINNAAFQAWIEQFHQRDPLPIWANSFASAHQMGTCRMGTSPSKSVVDPTGKVWGVDGLYVMDASVFPSASGVNPMVTNMAITDWTSRQLVETIKRDGLVVSSRF
ncbi:hypothetical protein PRK78_000013 [Emydomyces testavorans]|uniref:Long-chain-alcohol oxidase n=1 Tax=Emydomyces testavorans TaxID=2070801 RepID=A0AAF0DA36_9EURO|nr:hypothetical protein PRK78_000013 [Emydomyces testavorans]